LHEYKRFAEFKLTESGAGGFEGYASVFGVRDDGGDIVEAGAFKDTLSRFLTDGFISMGHDWEGQSIGTISNAREDARGLYLQAEYHSTPQAQEARTIAQERMARGKSVGLSIGYEILPGGAEFSDDGTRHLLKIGLFEVAQVTVPMLRSAGMTGVKAAWSTSYVNDLPDSAFAYIESGGEKDDQGKTVPRTLRHFPHHDSSGAPDPAHVRNALARIPQSDLSDSAKASAEAHVRKHATAMDIGKAHDHDDELSFDDHSEHVRVAVQEFGLRARSGSEIRLKEGRAISSSRRGRLADMRDALHGHANEIDALLTETAPPEKALTNEALFLEYQRTLAALRS